MGSRFTVKSMPCVSTLCDLQRLAHSVDKSLQLLLIELQAHPVTVSCISRAIEVSESQGNNRDGLTHSRGLGGGHSETHGPVDVLEDGGEERAGVLDEDLADFGSASVEGGGEWSNERIEGCLSKNSSQLFL